MQHSLAQCRCNGARDGHLSCPHDAAQSLLFSVTCVFVRFHLKQTHLVTAGMALDLTATNVSVPHPDPDKAALPPMPLLFLMTADFYLEAWSVINTGATSLLPKNNDAWRS